MIDRDTTALSIMRQCELLGLSRSSLLAAPLSAQAQQPTTKTARIG